MLLLIKPLELLLKKILSEKNLGKINTLQKGNLIKLVKEFKIKEEITEDLCTKHW